MYAAGALNAHNPWFLVMPDLSLYLQRVSYALRQGSQANDVAVLLPNDDVWASFKARIQKNRPPTSLGGFDETGSNITIDESMPAFLGSEVIPQILDAGFNFDFIDADSIEAAGIPYKVLILPGIDRIPSQSYEKIAEFARHGGIVVATRRMPATAPGYRDAEAESRRIQRISQALFHGSTATAHFVEDEHTLGGSLASWLQPDFVTSPRTPVIGYIHRHLEFGELYFVANTSNKPHSFGARFRTTAAHAEILDPFTGTTKGVADPRNAHFDLQPYESRIVFLSNAALAPVIKEPGLPGKRTDISHDWAVSFESGGPSIEMPNLISWTEEPEMRGYSGLATYQKTVEMESVDLRPGQSVQLDLGDGTPVPLPNPLPHFNMRAYLDGPVREGARVFVNGQPAGYIWHPPFRLEIAPLLKPGKNDLRIVVGNTAVNRLAETSLPTYRLLNDRFGVEFIPQDLKGLEPLPSGILGPVTLISSGPN